MRFTEITDADIGKILPIECLVTDIKTTSGPIIVTLDDGSRPFKALSFLKNIKVGMGMKAQLKIVKRNSGLESYLDRFSEIEGEQIMLAIESRLSENSKPIDIEPMVKADVFVKMDEIMTETASEIKKAALKNQQILIRFHGDADGYCGAYALEHAINSISSCKKIPSKTPFYDYTDMLRDSEYPFIVICDMGSNEQSELSLKKAKMLGIKVLIIDHHELSGSNKDLVSVFCNPNLFGGDLHQNTGILCTEIARKMIGEVPDHIKILPAIAGMGDWSSGDIFNGYLKIADDLGYDKDYLRQIAESIDFESYHSKFLEPRSMEQILGTDKQIQKQIVELLSSEIKGRKDRAVNTVLNHLQKEERNGAEIYRYDIKSFTKNGFPGYGKITGMVKDKLDSGKPILVLGISDENIAVRMKGIPEFSVVRLVKRLKEKFPDFLISGGGHNVAGGISFVSGGKEKIISEIYRYVADLMEKI